MLKLPYPLITAFILFTTLGAGCAATPETPSRAMDSSVQSPASEQALPTPEMARATQEAPDAAQGTYEVYEPAKLSRAQTGTVVLFFYAPWCPTCKTVNADIKSHLQDLPDHFSLLTVDYDSSTDLKQKYGVTYQHTFVQVDAAGTQLKKWSGGSTLQSILTQVN